MIPLHAAAPVETLVVTPPWAGLSTEQRAQLVEQMLRTKLLTRADLEAVLEQGRLP